MHQPILANIEIAPARAAPPLVRTAQCDVVLKRIHAREAPLLQVLHLVVHAPLFVVQGLHLPRAVVNNSNRRTESQLQSALADSERILRMANPAAHHGIDVHVKFGMLGQQLQLTVEHLQAFLRNFVGIDVINRNLQPLQPRAVQPLDALRNQQVSVRDQPRNDPPLAHMVNDVIQLWMQHRFAAADRNHGSAQILQPIDASQHLVGRHGLGKIIELVAVGASQIAAPDRNEMREQRMIRRHDRLQDLPQSVRVPLHRLKFAAQRR